MIRGEGSSMVDLGDRVRDKVTGLEGVAIARSVYLFGCAQVCVAPPAQGGKSEAAWFDEPRLEVVKCGAIDPADVSTDSEPGGPPRGPTSRPVPGR